ncbi:MAG: glycosyltransferase family 39 protein [Bacteroidetes bacterium]|nr:glycosyltransferase family 39 protein [Bacteroidota bacterium]
MNYIFQGILLAAFCIAGYGYAFRSMARNKEAMAIMLLMACGLALRIYTASDLYLHAWDERYHALVAKNMLKHFFLPTLYDNSVLATDYHYWTLGHVWLHKQPVPLWLIAISLKVFGVNAIAVRIPSIIMTTIGIKLMFDIGKHLYNSRVAFVSAFLYSISGILIEMSAGRIATDHPEVAFAFFILLGVWYSVRHAQTGKLLYTILTGVAIGLAILCKWLPALIVLPLWALLAYQRDRSLRRILLQGFMVLIVAAAVSLPWQLYIIHNFHEQAAWEYAFNARHITEPLDGNGAPFWFFFDRLRIDYGELIYLPVVWFTYITIRTREWNDMAVSIWFWVPYLFFSIAATKMNGYTLFAAPAIFLITANGFVVLKDRASDLGKYRWLAMVIAWLFILLPVRYSIERVKLFQDVERQPDWATDIQKLKGTSLDNEKTVLFNTQHPVETMFSTKMTAYEHTPPADTLETLKKEGYNVIVLK